MLQETKGLAEGALISYDGEPPVKPEDEDYTYTFAGWDPAVALNVTGDAVYTAKFNPVSKATEAPTEAPTETITINSGTDKLSNHGIQNLQKGNHLDFDGSGLPWGTFVAPTGKVFTKIVTNGTDDAMNWTGSAERVDHDNMMGEWYIDFETDEDGFRPFTISFTLADAPTGYTVTWKNGDSSTLKTDTVEDGAAPAYSGNVPEKAEDDDFTYTFSGWTDGTNTYGATDTLPAVTGDITYTATFDAVAKYEPGYYLVGTFTNWKVDPAYRLTENPEADGEYMITQVALTAGDEYKVVYAEAGKGMTWYPDGMENNISVETADKYNIYFRPDGTDDEAWDYGLIFTERYVPAESTEAINTINALPDAESVTLADAEQIEAARQAYDALTDEQKGYIDADTLKKLTDAEQKIANIEAANAVTEKIINLPANDEMTIEDKDDVDAANAAYNALTDDQKDLIDDGIYEKLSGALYMMECIVAADEITTRINNLPAADELTLNDKETVDGIRNDLDTFDDTALGLVDDEVISKLEAAEAKIADLEAAKAVDDQVNALPETISLDDQEDVEAAREAYEALTDDQKGYVEPETLTKLTAAELEISKLLADKEAADAVSEMINALPVNVTLKDREAVENVRTAYDELTDGEKFFVPEETVNKLTAAEKRIDDQLAASLAIFKINMIPAAITAESKPVIEAARTAYDALTDDQKAWVDSVYLTKLTDAEAALAQIEADIAAAKAVTDSINALPETIALDNKDAVEAGSCRLRRFDRRPEGSC